LLAASGAFYGLLVPEMLGLESVPSFWELQLQLPGGSERFYSIEHHYTLMLIYPNSSYKLLE